MQKKVRFLRYMEEVVDLKNKTMEKKTYKSQTKNIAQSPQKLRLVADLVRGKKVEKAADILQFLNKKGAGIVLKCLNSAIANAKSRDDVDPSKLYISSITVGDATSLKRIRFSSKATVSTITKRRSHLNIELSIK